MNGSSWTDRYGRSDNDSASNGSWGRSMGGWWRFIGSWWRFLRSWLDGWGTMISIVVFIDIHICVFVNIGVAVAV